ncbi:MAG: GldG family protein [Candidatus Spyradosoma sp.]
MHRRPSLFSLKDFRGVRFIGRLNRGVQIVLALALIAGLNWIAAVPSCCTRWDLDFENRRGIWPETRAQLNELAKKAPENVSPENPWVRLIVTLRPADAGTPGDQASAVALLRKQLLRLVDDFKYETQQSRRPGWIRFETADLVKNTRLNRELEKFGALPPTTAIVVLSGDNCRTVTAEELVRLRPGAAGNEPEIDGFRGEEAIMSAILSVTDGVSPAAYFLSGNGELSIDSTSRSYGLSSFAQTLRSRRIRTNTLNLSVAPDVPADASLVVIADPRVPISPQTEEKLSRYLRERNGRVLAMINPGSDCGLENLFFDWGLQLQDVFVTENSPLCRLPDGNVAVRGFPSKPHKTAEILVSLNLPVVSSQFRSVEADFGAKEDRTRTVTPLFYSSGNPQNTAGTPSSWGERDYRKPPYRFDVRRGDIDGPVPLGAVSERVAGTRLGVNIPGGRLVVIGTGDLATNAQLENGGNKIFLLNTVNWLIDRDVMLNIPPRPISEFRLKATPPDLAHVGWNFLFFPAGFALFGLLVFYWRKRN